MTENLKEKERLLQNPFKPEELEWRVQRAYKDQEGKIFLYVIPYVNNRAIQRRFDEVFTPFGWTNEYKEWRDKGVACGISVKIGDEWITKWDGADQTDIEATKGGFSGSQKRTACQWGVGRYLYDLDEFRVPLLKDRPSNAKPYEYVSGKIKDGKGQDGRDKYMDYKGYYIIPDLPVWALPQGSKGNTPGGKSGASTGQPGSATGTEKNSTKEDKPPVNGKGMEAEKQDTPQTEQGTLDGGNEPDQAAPDGDGTSESFKDRLIHGNIVKFIITGEPEFNKSNGKGKKFGEVHAVDIDGNEVYRLIAWGDDQNLLKGVVNDTVVDVSGTYQLQTKAPVKNIVVIKSLDIFGTVQQEALG